MVVPSLWYENAPLVIYSATRGWHPRGRVQPWRVWRRLSTTRRMACSSSLAIAERL